MMAVFSLSALNGLFLCTLRALLQRISLILTAPPKITEEDYLRMKKLATRDKVREKFEKSLSEKRNEEIFRRIKSTPAYYHHKDWEDDYVKQVYRCFLLRFVVC